MKHQIFMTFFLFVNPIGVRDGLMAQEDPLAFSPAFDRTAMVTWMRDQSPQRPARITLFNDSEPLTLEYTITYELFATEGGNWLHYEMIEYSDGRQEASAYTTGGIGRLPGDRILVQFEFREVNLDTDIELDWVTRTGRLKKPVDQLTVIGYGTCDYGEEDGEEQFVHYCIWPRKTQLRGVEGLRVHTFYGGGWPYHIHDRVGYLSTSYGHEDLEWSDAGIMLNLQSGSQVLLSGDPLQDRVDPDLSYSDLICENGCIRSMQDLEEYHEISRRLWESGFGRDEETTEEE